MIVQRSSGTPFKRGPVQADGGPNEGPNQPGLLLCSDFPTVKIVCEVLRVILFFVCLGFLSKQTAISEVIRVGKEKEALLFHNSGLCFFFF